MGHLEDGPKAAGREQFLQQSTVACDSEMAEAGSMKTLV